jgi:endoglucanase
MNRRILLLLGFVLLIIVAVAGGAGVYVLLNSAGSNSPGSAGTPVGNTPVALKGCGITATSTGYTFSWLHVSGGTIMDEHNCVVVLQGFNWSQLEFGNAVGGSPKTGISEQGIAWYNQTFHMNVWRIPLNAYWWNTNVYVPRANMSYQAWIQQIIRWAEKYGDYVILTKGPQFHAPPCGGAVTFCPPQDYGKQTGDPQQRTTGQYIDEALTMWTSVARLYANDPAVLYDSWNEMNTDTQTWRQSENELIASIRAQNPRSLVFLGGPFFKDSITPLVDGEVPDFSQSNLVYDFHVYDGFNGTYLNKHCQEPLG